MLIKKKLKSYFKIFTMGIVSYFVFLVLAFNLFHCMRTAVKACQHLISKADVWQLLQILHHYIIRYKLQHEEMFSNENLWRKAFNSIFTAVIMSQAITPNTTALLTHEKRWGYSEIQQLPCSSWKRRRV